MERVSKNEMVLLRELRTLEPGTVLEIPEKGETNWRLTGKGWEAQGVTLWSVLAQAVLSLRHKQST